MLNKVIIGNQKMNLTTSQTRKFINAFVPMVEHLNCDIAICVPYTNLAVCKRALKDTNVTFGAQNVSEFEKGAYTGEINSEMLADIGCKLTLVGHSERRKYFSEHNSEINSKIKQNLKYNITSVLCIGESKRERTAGQTRNVICKQLDECLSGLYENELENIVVAYEPIWAIGTGQTATGKQIEEAVSIIREEIARLYTDKASKNIVVLYGGSVKPDNVKNFINIKNLNGFLVGGVSLDAKAFSELIQVYVGKPVKK